MSVSDYKIKSQESFVKQCQKAFNKQTAVCNQYMDLNSPELLKAMQVLYTIRNVFVQQEEKLEVMKRK